MGEVAPTVSDPNHRLDDKHPLRHPGGLPQPGLADVQSHCLYRLYWVPAITLLRADRLDVTDWNLLLTAITSLQS